MKSYVLIFAALLTLLALSCSGGGAIIPEYNVEGYVIVITGDSITSHIGQDSFNAAEPDFDFRSVLPPSPDGIETVTIVNTAIGGNMTMDIRKRFVRDCVNYHPDIAIINGGTNDIDHKMVSIESFVESWKRMLDECNDNGIRAVVMGVVPSTFFTDEQMMDRDAWNLALRNLTETYDGFIFVDPDPYVGDHRENGPEENLWNISEELDEGDGIHFNDAGYVELSRAILDALKD